MADGIKEWFLIVKGNTKRDEMVNSREGASIEPLRSEDMKKRSILTQVRIVRKNIKGRAIKCMTILCF